MKNHWRLSLAALFFIVALPSIADLPTDDQQWELQKDEAGIMVYTREIPSSDFKAFKAVTDIEAPLENVMAVMANPKSCLDWVHGCIFSEGFDAHSFNDRYAYSVNDLPWPAQDRDYVIHIRTTSDPQSGEIIMDLNAVDDARPVTDDYVRVEHSDTLYRFSRNDDGTTHMVWIQHTEPNGALPSWLVNALATDIPLKSLERLEALAQETRYRDFEILYDDEGSIVGVKPRQSPSNLARNGDQKEKD